jgi:predicted MPP superfamily phosphohydrolase
MPVFQANRTYTKSLDLFVDGYVDIIDRIRQKPPQGFAWLFVSRRRGRKTWTLHGIHEQLGSANARLTDFGLDLINIEPAGRADFVHLFDEPSMLFEREGGVKKFLDDCRKIHDAGERIMLALTPHELSLIRKQDERCMQIAEFETRVPFPRFSDARARSQARSTEAKNLLEQLPPDWRSTPFLLELVFEVQEKYPSLALQSLLRAVLDRANREGYSHRVLRESLNEKQRKLVVAVAHGAAPDSTPTRDHEWLIDTGYLHRSPGSDARYQLSDPVLAANLSPLRIHHISDLHFGKFTAQSIDDKSGGGRLGALAGQRAVRDEYLETVKAMGARGTAPHLVVVSGDIGERSEDDEYPEAQKFFAALRKLLADDLHLDDDAPRILMVGGNHDVERKWAQDTDPQKRHRLFADAFPLTHYRRPEMEVSPETRKVATAKYVNFDLEILLLGSAEAGQEVEDMVRQGERLRLLEAEAAKAATGSASLSADTIEKNAIEYARIDPGLVHHLDLDRAQSHTWEHKVRIAVLHHPVSPLPSTEIAKYAGLLNAGRVKEVLFKHRFALILHGHLHSAWFLEERWIGKKWTLRIAAAASLGSQQIAESNGFNEIHIQRHIKFGASAADPVTSAPEIVAYRYVRRGAHDWSIEETMGPFSPGQQDSNSSA